MNENGGESSAFKGYVESVIHNLNGPLPGGLKLIDELLNVLATNLDNSRYMTSARLFQVGFSSWRNSLLLAQAGAAGQVPICLRHAVETNMYCFLFSRSPEWEAIWWDRETNDAAKKKLRSGREGPLQESKRILGVENPRLLELSTSTLDHLIDFGAHPNVFQLVNVTTHEVSREDLTETFLTALLADDETRVRSLINCIGVGLLIIDFFELIWPDRFSFLLGPEKRDISFRQTQLFIQSSRAATTAQ